MSNLTLDKATRYGRQYEMVENQSRPKLNKELDQVCAELSSIEAVAKQVEVELVTELVMEQVMADEEAADMVEGDSVMMSRSRRQGMSSVVSFTITMPGISPVLPKERSAITATRHDHFKGVCRRKRKSRTQEVVEDELDEIYIGAV